MSESEHKKKKYVSLTRSLPLEKIVGTEADELVENQPISSSFISHTKSLGFMDMEPVQDDAPLLVPRLELLVVFAESTPADKAYQYTVHWIQAASKAAPELGLQYDTVHSRAEKGTVIVVLTPTVPNVDADRLRAVASLLEQTITNIAEVQNSLVRVAA